MAGNPGDEDPFGLILRAAQMLHGREDSSPQEVAPANSESEIGRPSSVQCQLASRVGRQRYRLPANQPARYSCLRSWRAMFPHGIRASGVICMLVRGRWYGTWKCRVFKKEPALTLLQAT